MELAILRRERGEAAGHWQRYAYAPAAPAETVATALAALNAAGADIEWDCGCLQARCGACAMVINGRPRLACDARLDELAEPVRLEPLRKFPVVRDLRVDRSVMRENLAALRLWFSAPAETGDAAAPLAFEAGRCLQCGCCLEVCPNFAPGEDFTGMAGAAPAARLLARLPAAQRREAAALYRKHFYAGCGKSLACRDVCPAGIDVEGLLLHSNAVAVWNRFFKRRK